LQRPDPVLRGPVEIIVAAVSSLLRRSHKRVVEFVAGAQIGHVERPAGAVMRVGTALLVLGAAEVGEHVVIRPAGVAELAPQIEILALATDVDQPVDRARPAQHLAARPRQASAGELGLRLGLELPGDLRMIDIAVEAGRDVDPRVAVPAARFKEQHPGRRGRTQAVRQHASGRARADNDVIELRSVLHGCSRVVLPLYRRVRVCGVPPT